MLYIPSELWLKQFKIFETCFKNYHGEITDTIFHRDSSGNIAKQPFSTLFHIICNQIGFKGDIRDYDPTESFIHEEIIEKFILWRIFIRVRALNKKNSAENFDKIARNKNENREKRKRDYSQAVSLNLKAFLKNVVIF
jgi:hypothetical protein